MPAGIEVYQALLLVPDGGLAYEAPSLVAVARQVAAHIADDIHRLCEELAGGDEFRINDVLGDLRWNVSMYINIQAGRWHHFKGINYVDHP
jgi:hypothetical protein